MNIVTDASVLIFLGKIKQIELLSALFEKGSFYISEDVRLEVMGEHLMLQERDYLSRALSAWNIKSIKPNFKGTNRLSRSDLSVIELANKVKANIVLVDDKLLRGILGSQEFKVMGTLGIFLLANRKNILSRQEIKNITNELITKHRFRISAKTFQAFEAQLDSTI